MKNMHKINNLQAILNKLNLCHFFINTYKIEKNAFLKVFYATEEKVIISIIFNVATSCNQLATLILNNISNVIIQSVFIFHAYPNI